MEKLLYSIGEVARIIGVNVDVVRNWTKILGARIKCERNSRGARFYKKEDIEVLRQFHYLVKDKKMTLEGAKKQIAASSSAVRSRVNVVESLTEIKAQLLELRSVLD